MEDIVNLVRGKLNKQRRITLSTLVTLDVHCRDVVNELANNNVCHDMDFKWLSQLRWCLIKKKKNILDLTILHF